MGVLLSVIDQNFPPKAKWSVDDIPDLSNKVVIVTGKPRKTVHIQWVALTVNSGANIGLGYETAKVIG